MIYHAESEIGSAHAHMCLTISRKISVWNDEML